MLNSARRTRVVVLLTTIAAMLASLLVSPPAEAAITSPTPPVPPAATNVVGTVAISDNQVGSTSPPASCTSSSLSGAAAKGITKFEIFKGNSTAAADRILVNHFNNGVTGTIFGFPVTLDPATAAWQTNTSTLVVPRGLYTIKPSYFKRTGTGSCSSATSCAAPVVPGYNVLTSSGATTGTCANAINVGAAEAVPSGAPVLIDVQNRYDLALTNAPAGGAPYLVTDAGPTTVTVTARITDPGRAANTAVNGQTVNFTLANKPGGGDLTQSAVTATVGATSGVASTTFDLAGWSFGSHTLTVSPGFATTSTFLAPNPVVNAIKFGGASVTAYTGATSVYWNEPLPVAAHVQAAVAGGGNPADGAVKFTIDPSGAPVSTTVPSVDAFGDASTTMLMTKNPPSTGLKVDYLGSSDGAFLPSSATSTINILKRPTSLAYTGPAATRWGDQMTLEAKLTDVRFGTPVAGKTVVFNVGSQTASAVTGADGIASTQVPATAEVGSYAATATFAGDSNYIGSAAAQTVSITFRHVFDDTLSTARTYLEPETRQFEYQSPTGELSGIRSAPLLVSIFLPTNLQWPGLPTLPTIPPHPFGNLLNPPTVDLGYLAKAASDLIAYISNRLAVIVGTEPPSVEAPPVEPPATPTSNQAAGVDVGGVNLNGTRATTPTNTPSNPATLGGFTLRELIEGIKNGDLPTDVTACEVLTTSTCERRLAVLVYPPQDSLAQVGVFDLRTRSFISLVAFQDDARLMLNLVGCTAAPIACFNAPTRPPTWVPTWLPDPPPPYPNPFQLLPILPTLDPPTLAEIQAAAQLILGSIEPPAPPSPDSLVATLLGIVGGVDPGSPPVDPGTLPIDPGTLPVDPSTLPLPDLSTLPLPVGTASVVDPASLLSSVLGIVGDPLGALSGNRSASSERDLPTLPVDPGTLPIDPGSPPVDPGTLPLPDPGSPPDPGTPPTVPPIPPAPDPGTIPLPVEPPVPLPEIPDLPIPDPNTLIGSIMTQVYAAAAALQTTPERILNMILDFEVPTLDGTTQMVSASLQDLIDRLNGTYVAGGPNTGIFGLPEVSVGQIMHFFLHLETALAPKSTNLDAVQSCKTSPTIPRASCPTADRTRPFAFIENEVIPQYHVSTSPYVPKTPSIIGLNPLALALPLALGTVPAELPPEIGASIPPELKQALLLYHPGGNFINIQGGGWATGRHSAGNIGLGQNLDTAQRATTPASPWPIWLPFFTATSLTLTDHSIDFIGWGPPSSNSHTCSNSFVSEAQVNGVYMSTYKGGGLCTSTGLMVLSDGVAVFNGSPVNFRTDLAPLWSPAPPGVDVAVNLISGVLAAVLPADVLTAVLGAAGTVTGLVPDTGSLPVDPGTLPVDPGTLPIPEPPPVTPPV